jgi:hypothetical protein
MKTLEKRMEEFGLDPIWGLTAPKLAGSRLFGRLGFLKKSLFCNFIADHLPADLPSQSTDKSICDLKTSAICRVFLETKSTALVFMS